VPHRGEMVAAPGRRGRDPVKCRSQPRGIVVGLARPAGNSDPGNPASLLARLVRRRR
jgi:hypothetical protein